MIKEAAAAGADTGTDTTTKTTQLHTTGVTQHQHQTPNSRHRYIETTRPTQGDPKQHSRAS